MLSMDLPTWTILPDTSEDIDGEPSEDELVQSPPNTSFQFSKRKLNHNAVNPPSKRQKPPSTHLQQVYSQVAAQALAVGFAGPTGGPSSDPSQLHKIEESIRKCSELIPHLDDTSERQPGKNKKLKLATIGPSTPTQRHRISSPFSKHYNGPSDSQVKGNLATSQSAFGNGARNSVVPEVVSNSTGAHDTSSIALARQQKDSTIPPRLVYSWPVSPSAIELKLKLDNLFGPGDLSRAFKRKPSLLKESRLPDQGDPTSRAPSSDAVLGSEDSGRGTGGEEVGGVGTERLSPWKTRKDLRPLRPTS